MIIAFLIFTCLLVGALNHKSVTILGGTLIPCMKSVIVVKATKLRCVLALGLQSHHSSTLGILSVLNRERESASKFRLV